MRKPLNIIAALIAAELTYLVIRDGIQRRTQDRCWQQQVAHENMLARDAREAQDKIADATQRVAVSTIETNSSVREFYIGAAAAQLAAQLGDEDPA